MNRNLFRKEAVCAREQDYGTTLKSKPVSFTVLTCIATGFVVIAAVFACQATYARKERVAGILVPDKGFVKVFPLQPGIVTHKLVHEGQFVRAGESVYTLSAERSRNEGAGAESALIALLQQRKASLQQEHTGTTTLTVLERQAAETKLSSLTLEIKELRKQSEVHRKRVNFSRESIERYLKLRQQGYISQPQLEQQNDLLVQQQMKESELDRTIIVLQRERDAISKSLQVENIRINNAALALNRSAQELQQQMTELETRRAYPVSAPVAGEIASTLVEPGQMATTTEPLLTILPSGHLLEARLLLPPRSAGFLRLGQQVNVRYHAYPYQKFGSHVGEIVEIDKNVTSSGEVFSLINQKEPGYLVTVRLREQTIRTYDQPVRLRPGMSLDADIIVDNRRLIEWLFEPILGVTGRF